MIPTFLLRGNARYNTNIFRLSRAFTSHTLALLFPPKKTDVKTTKKIENLDPIGISYLFGLQMYVFLLVNGLILLGARVELILFHFALQSKKINLNGIPCTASFREPLLSPYNTAWARETYLLV